jgi:hypothetical protein
LACLLVLQVGCGAVLTTATVSTPQSILKAVRSGPDRVALEILQVRVPTGDKQLAAELWQASDEQRLDLEVRNRLLSNGFRAGVISGVMPDSLARSLNLLDEAKPDTDLNERVITDDTATSKVTRRVLQLKRNEPAAIQASEVQSQVNILLNSPDGLQGKSYREAQGVYTLRAAAVPNQQVEVQLIPELQFGELKNRYAGSDQGIFVVTPSRERKVFEDMKLSVALSPGEMLLVTSVPNTPGSLGNAFHEQRQSEVAEQKLVMVRLVEVPRSEILVDAASPN